MLPQSVRGLMAASGKGGVGKSLMAINVAANLAARGLKVGLLDADVRAPNDTYLLNMDDMLDTLEEDEDRRIIAPEVPGVPGLRIWSSALFFANRREISFAGSEVRSFLFQSAHEVSWGDDLELMVIDMDPSSGDSLKAMAEIFAPEKRFLRAPMQRLAVALISTDDLSSINDCQRMAHACMGANIPIVGVIGNMVGSHCDGHGGPIVCSCGMRVSFGSEENLRELAAAAAAPYLASIPWNPSWRSTPGKTALHPDIHAFQVLADRVKEGSFWAS